MFYMCIPILLLIFIKDTLHLSDSQYGYTQTISRLASFIVFGILAKYFTINLATSFKSFVPSFYTIWRKYFLHRLYRNNRTTLYSI